MFAAATGVAMLHVLDDAFVGKQPGTSAADHLLAAVVLLAVLAGSLALYPRLRAGARAALAVGLGIVITTAGAMHVVHAVVDEAERSDFTGVLAMIGGVALIALGLVVAWRAPAPASWKRRWGKRGAIAAGALLVGFYVVLPIGAAIFVTHKFREPIDGTFALGLSGGAMALIESAARRADLRAVVAEGAGARAYGDPLDIPDAGKWVTLPYTTVLFAAAQVLSGWPEARSVGDFVGVGRPGRVLLIAAGGTWARSTS